MNNPRNRNLLIIIGVLLLTNIAVLAYFLGQKKPGKPGFATSKERSGIGEMLQKEVGFNDDQLAQYKVLKDQQRETLRPMFDDMRKSKDSLFRLLSYTGQADSLVDQVTDAIARKQKTLDLQTFNYFKKVRGLCTPEQQPRYDSLIVRTFRKMGGKSTRQNDQEKNKQDKK
jgi:Spy/CpxP family protein refolding chaperone